MNFGANFFLMRRALSENRQRQPSNKTDSRKYMPGLDPLEKEATITDIQPLGKYEADRMMKYVNRLLKRGGLTATEKKAFNFWKANLVVENAKGIIHQEFMRDFWAWLLGRGKESDHVKCPWYRQALTNDAEVAAYVDSFIRKRHEYQMKMALLKMRHPIGINQHYLYYKYAVRQTEIDADNFLDDWKLFLQEFGEARESGQAERNMDAIEGPYDGEQNIHEMAPYGSKRVEVGKASHDRKVEQMIKSGARSFHDDDMSDEDGELPVSRDRRSLPRPPPPPPKQRFAQPLPSSAFVPQDFVVPATPVAVPPKEKEEIEPEDSPRQEPPDNRPLMPQPIEPVDDKPTDSNNLVEEEGGSDLELPDVPTKIPERLEDVLKAEQAADAEKARQFEEQQKRNRRQWDEAFEAAATRNRQQDLQPVGQAFRELQATMSHIEHQRQFDQAEERLERVRARQKELEIIGLQDEALVEAAKDLEAVKTNAEAEKANAERRHQEVLNALRERTAQIEQKQADTDKLLQNMQTEMQVLARQPRGLTVEMTEALKNQAVLLNQSMAERLKQQGEANRKELEKFIESRQNKLQADMLDEMAKHGAVQLEKVLSKVNEQIALERENARQAQESKIAEAQQLLVSEMEKLKKGTEANVSEMNKALMQAVGDKLNALNVEELVENFNNAENRMNDYIQQSAELEGRFGRIGTIANNFEQNIADMHASIGRAKGAFVKAVEKVNEQAGALALLQDEVRSQLRKIDALRESANTEVFAAEDRHRLNLEAQAQQAEAVLNRYAARQEERLNDLQKALDRSDKRLRRMQRERVEQSRRQVDRIRNTVQGRFEPVAAPEIPAEPVPAVEEVQENPVQMEVEQNQPPAEVVAEAAASPVDEYESMPTLDEMQPVAKAPKFELIGRLKELANWAFEPLQGAFAQEPLQRIQEEISASAEAEIEAEKEEESNLIGQAEEAQARSERLAKGRAARMILLNDLEQAERQLKELESQAQEQEMIEFYAARATEIAEAAREVKQRVSADQRALAEAEKFTRNKQERERPTYEKMATSEKKNSTTPVKQMSAVKNAPLGQASGRTNKGSLPKVFSAAEREARKQRDEEFRRNNAELMKRLPKREREQETESEQDNVEMVADEETRQFLRTQADFINTGDDEMMDHAAQEILSLGLLAGMSASEIDVERRHDDAWDSVSYGQRLMAALNKVSARLGGKKHKLHLEREDEMEMEGRFQLNEELTK